MKELACREADSHIKHILRDCVLQTTEYEEKIYTTVPFSDPHTHKLQEHLFGKRRGGLYRYGQLIHEEIGHGRTHPNVFREVLGRPKKMRFLPEKGGWDKREDFVTVAPYPHVNKRTYPICELSIDVNTIHTPIVASRLDNLDRNTFKSVKKHMKQHKEYIAQQLHQQQLQQQQLHQQFASFQDKSKEHTVSSDEKKRKRSGEKKKRKRSGEKNPNTLQMLAQTDANNNFQVKNEPDYEFSKELDNAFGFDSA